MTARALRTPGRSWLCEHPIRAAPSVRHRTSCDVIPTHSTISHLACVVQNASETDDFVDRKTVLITQTSPLCVCFLTRDVPMTTLKADPLALWYGRRSLRTTRSR